LDLLIVELILIQQMAAISVARSSHRGLLTLAIIMVIATDDLSPMLIKSTTILQECPDGLYPQSGFVIWEQKISTR
jgi:hypothetical protein